MPRRIAIRTHSADRASGSAAIARARLSSTLLRDRRPGQPGPGDSAAPAAPAQPDLLDLLLATGSSTGRGRP